MFSSVQELQRASKMLTTQTSTAEEWKVCFKKKKKIVFFLNFLKLVILVIWVISILRNAQ